MLAVFDREQRSAEDKSVIKMNGDPCRVARKKADQSAAVAYLGHFWVINGKTSRGRKKGLFVVAGDAGKGKAVSVTSGRERCGDEYQ